VIEDHRAFRAHRMPDHPGDRGAVLLGPGASRSSPYQPWPDTPHGPITGTERGLAASDPV